MRIQSILETENDNIPKKLDVIPEKIKKLKEYKPSTETYSIRLDANECPFPPSDAMLNEFSNELKRIKFNRYPDPYASALSEELARIYKMNPYSIVVGNGSDELISLICSGFTEPGDKVTVAVPDFSMYEFYSTLCKAEVLRFEKDYTNDFDLDELSKFVNENGSKIVILSNPCNPTGLVKSKMEIEKFILRTNALIVIDEAYMEFSALDSSIFKLAADTENLIVLKTMSKAYGMAGLRIGFATGNDELVSALRKIKSPYNVNAVSQEFARIVLTHYDEILERTELISNLTLKLSAELSKIDSDSIKLIYPSAVNFVLVRMESENKAIGLYEELKERSIIVRCFADMCSLRITCGTPEENAVLLKAVEEIILEMDKESWKKYE